MEERWGRREFRHIWVSRGGGDCDLPGCRGGAAGGSTRFCSRPAAAEQTDNSHDESTKGLLRKNVAAKPRECEVRLADGRRVRQSRDEPDPVGCRKAQHQAKMIVAQTVSKSFTRAQISNCAVFQGATPDSATSSSAPTSPNCRPISARLWRRTRRAFRASNAARMTSPHCLGCVASDRAIAEKSRRPFPRTATCATCGNARWDGSARTRTATNGTLCRASAAAECDDYMSTATAPVALPSERLVAG